MVKDLQLILTIVFIQIDTHTPTHACTLNFMPVGHSCKGGNYDNFLDKNAPSSITQKRKEVDAFQRRPEQRDKGLNVKNRSSTDSN